jgi:hypothetical protein
LRIKLFLPSAPDQQALLGELHLSPSDSERLPVRNFAKGGRFV